MKRLFLEQFRNHKLSNLYAIKGGDGSTSYRTSSGRTGTDCYSDDDGDGKLSCGDGVLLDTGQWITQCQ